MKFEPPQFQQLEPRLLLSSSPLPGDLNGDNFTDDADLAILLNNWEPNNSTNDDDLSVILSNWTGSATKYKSLEIKQDLPDPITSGKYSDLSHMPLFVDGPDYDDAVQGRVGDCYFWAALSSLAISDPDILEEAITDLGDETYSVRFYRDGEAVYYRVDADLPTFSGKLVSITPDGEIWAALMEKAYVMYQGENSYSSLNGGWMVHVYRDITNQGYKWLHTGSISDEELVVSIAQDMNDGHAVSALSYHFSYVSAGPPIVGGHAYSVCSVEEIGNEWYITVYNPWGYDGREWDDNYQDGLLRLPISLFKERFLALNVSLA